MTVAEVVLRPGTQVGMLDRIPLSKGGAHEILRRAVNTDLCRHGSDQGNLIADFCGLRQVVGYLKVG